MYEVIFQYIKGCVMCSTIKPGNEKIGLYMPLPVPHDHGTKFPWILLEEFLCLGEGIIRCISWLIISARCAFFFHEKSE